MSHAVTLLLGVHAHQPVGNFAAVIEEAHQLCYGPFLRTLSRFPEFRFSVHFSGWLLDQLQQHHPDDMALLAAMVSRGQVEMFGGGECEPVLAAIPQRDRRGQVKLLSDKLERRFGRRPRGAWLTERVWEATVVPALADSDIAYVTVDDYHFLCTGREERELDGYYTTEEDGRSVDLFPISEALRYRLPFAAAADAVAFLEDQAKGGHDAAIYFDDIEKFGIWPETHEWVYGRGWLEQFISGVLASPHIRTGLFGDYQRSRRSRGIVYLPTTSYSEMNEWTLPAAAAEVYAQLLEREKAEGNLAAHRPFLRGGIWRNFLSRYPEANWMHKRMLALSARLAALPETAATPALRELLYRAQANDAYWHGLFGGLYLPHLRRSVWHDLLRLEAALERISPRPGSETSDIDLDGCDETFLRSASLQAVIRDDGHGAVHELAAYAFGHNFGDTLRRHSEHYYRKLGRAPAAATASGGIPSAHDRIDFKHDIFPQDTVPDAAPRAIFVDWLGGADGPATPLADYVSGDGANFAATAGGGRISKHLAVDQNRLSASYRFDGAAPAAFTCRINLAMPSCDGFSGRYILADGRIPCGFGQDLVLDAATELSLDDRELRGRLVFRSSRPVRIEAAPHHTVSQSEAGFEKIMQAACLTVSWSPAPGDETTLSLEVVADPA